MKEEVVPTKIQLDDGTVVPFDGANRPSGAWRLRDDGTLVRDTNDEAMRKRAATIPKEVKP